MQRALILLAIIVGAILIAAALEDRGAEIKDRKAEAGASTTATVIVDPARATIEALQTQIAQLLSGNSDEPKSTAKAGGNGGSGGTSDPTPTSNEDGEETTASKGGVDCPTTNSDWLGMVTSELGSDGYLMSNTVHNDDFDFIRVKLTNSWTLPSGWSSNIDGATVLEAGRVYSIYPPFACQGHIG